MTAADAAVAILRAEGVTHAFGVPGAAINPLYAAMRRDGNIDHVLARPIVPRSHCTIATLICNAIDDRTMSFCRGQPFRPLQFFGLIGVRPVRSSGA